MGQLRNRDQRITKPDVIRQQPHDRESSSQPSHLEQRLAAGRRNTRAPARRPGRRAGLEDGLDGGGELGGLDAG
jgi:hypothetical protein